MDLYTEPCEPEQTIQVLQENKVITWERRQNTSISIKKSKHFLKLRTKNSGYITTNIHQKGTD